MAAAGPARALGELPGGGGVPAADDVQQTALLAASGPSELGSKDLPLSTPTWRCQLDADAKAEAEESEEEGDAEREDDAGRVSATAQLSKALRRHGGGAPASGGRAGRGFLVAPKRGRRGGRPLLERLSRTEERPGPAEEEPAVGETSPEPGADLGEWCQASPSSAPRLRRWQPRRWPGRPRSPPGAAPGDASVPAWAQWPGTGTAARPRDGPLKGDGEDHWETSPGAYFERICIGFKDPGEEPEDEATTCEGEEAEDEVSDWEDLNDETTEVVIGYRAEVGPGHGLPEGGRENSEAEDSDAEAGEASSELGAHDAEGANSGVPGDFVGDVDAIAFPLPLQGRVSHILFVVHGMGATPEALRKNSKDLRENFGAMQKYWFWHTDVNVHVEIIDWKSALSTEQSTIFDRITPAEARTTRMSLNATLSDVIFYKTAHHRAKIHEIVTRKMNTRYQALRADPAGRCVDARVSIVGHSLGSVIAYDVLSGFGSEDTPALEFEVDNYFLWGSPLAAFVSIADIEHQSGKFTLPSRITTYNIFHPHDPVAFRLEPLYYHDQDQIAPEMIPHWVNNGIEPSMQWVRSYEYAKVLAHQKWASLKSRMWEAVGSSTQLDACRAQWDSYLNSDPDALCMPATGSRDPADTNAQQEEAVEETLLGPRMRIDYALQEHLVEGYVESYALLQSHFCYWTSHDVSLFMLKKLSKQDVAGLSFLEKEQLEADAARRAAGAGADAATGAAAAEGDRGTLSMLPVLPDKADLLRRLGEVPCIGGRRHMCDRDVSEATY